MQFSIRALLLAMAIIGFGVAIGKGCTYVYLNADVVARSYWNADLISIMSDQGIRAEDVDVRHGNRIICHVWKTSSSPSVIQAHIDRFGLRRVASSGPEIRELKSQFPPAWRWPDHGKIDCYANPVGMPHIPDGGTLMILMHDRQDGVLYCLHFFNF